MRVFTVAYARDIAQCLPPTNQSGGIWVAKYIYKNYNYKKLKGQHFEDREGCMGKIENCLVV